MTLEIGSRVGRWTIVGERYYRGTNAVFPCRCECGQIKDVPYANLLSRSRSCGCLRREQMTSHGCSSARAYSIWMNMRRRCKSSVARYGGRGISVCSEWEQSFDAFVRDMGYPPSPSHSIDRVDNDGDYSPENCRWATGSQQSRNTSRNVMLTLGNQTRCLTDWAKAMGISQVALKKRVKRWGIQRALTTPKHSGYTVGLVRDAINSNGGDGNGKA